MRKFQTCILLAGLVLSACVNVVPQSSTSAPPAFVTSTLPPTRPALVLPTGTEMTSTPDPSITTTPGVETTTTPGTGSTEAASGACKDSAAMIEDVTVPDNTVMTKGQKFTKTWRFLNNGKCNWTGYTIAFFAGDRMGSPDSVPIPDTPAGKTVDVSVDLTAPSVDGSYTGFYVLKNDKGETLPIGIEQSFWLKILIGNAVAAPVATPVTSNGTVVVPTVSVKGELHQLQHQFILRQPDRWTDQRCPYPGWPANVKCQCTVTGRRPGSFHRHGLPQPAQPHRLGQFLSRASASPPPDMPLLLPQRSSTAAAIPRPPSTGG